MKQKLDQFSQLEYSELKQKPVIAPGNEEIAFENLVFKTPTGKIELFSSQAAQDWNVNPLPDFVQRVEGEHNSEIIEKYPFNLLTPNTKDRIHSQFGNLKMIDYLAGEPVLIMNPIDGNVKMLAQNDQVKVYNDRGEITLKVQFDYSIKRGCVSIFNGLWMKEGGSVNLLSAPRETDMGHGTAFHDCMVDVKKRNN